MGGVPAGFFCYYEDTDTAWRLRLAGWDVLAVPGARVRPTGTGRAPGRARWRFHRWNERNRLLMLLRCAPRGSRWASWRGSPMTLALPVLPLRGAEVPDALNYTLRPALRVLAEVLARYPRRWRPGS